MLGLRVSPDIKRKLDDAAVKSGRSQSQETELRLQQSFDAETNEKRIVEKVSEMLEKQEVKVKDELAEIKQRLLDLIELSKKEDVSDGGKG
jgi:predicted transcriptional regulator